MNAPGARDRAAGRLWRRPRARWLLGIPLGGFLMFVLGLVAFAGYETSMKATSTLEFCGGACHEMEAFVLPEYQASVHGSTRTGVVAVCADCHLPKAFVPKMMRKIEATRHEVWHWLIGTIDTREKFEARREYLAERVWTLMRETDSRECRSCHSFERMNFEKQERFASRRHERAAKEGKTCIDCHRGVAHVLPESGDEDDE